MPGDETPLPPPPARPDARSCCGRGCSPCIFDYHAVALDRWKTAIRARGHDPELLLQDTAPEHRGIAPH